MKNIVDIGSRGAERLGGYQVPIANSLSLDTAPHIATLKKFPLQRIEADTIDGIKRSVDVRSLLLGHPRIFDFVHSLAPYQPMLYARQGERSVLGMLSPNYDGTGQAPLSAIKVIPLRTAYPLTANLLPDPRMATMLTGAAVSEAKGVGGHEGNIIEDFEHKATILGAVSMGNPAIAQNHQNHVVRTQSSVATGLTNGRLGALYAPGTQSDFSGYGEPLIFTKEAVTASDAIYFPDSFLDNAEAFGGYYTDAARIMLGAGMQALYENRGAGMLGEIERLQAQVAGRT